MNQKELQNRTRKFHVSVIRLCRKFPKDAAGFETAKQLIRSAGSIGANYRATARAKSYPDFSHKINIVLEEADESLYWLDVVKEAEICNAPELDALIKESNELTAIFTAATKTARTKLKQ
jgi:four helix bundle protein